MIFFIQAEDGIRDYKVTGVQTCALPISAFTNGQGRGCVPADHRLCFSRARSHALKEADLVIVAGTPLDFRLGFGQFAAAKVVHLDHRVAEHVDLAASSDARLDVVLEALADGIGSARDTKSWVEALRATEDSKRDAAQGELRSAQTPIHPMR